MDENLRNKLEELDGNITHEIIVGKENAELDQQEKLLNQKKEKTKRFRDAINKKFLNGKKEHQTKFEIQASLGAYKKLSTDVFFEASPYVVDTSANTLTTLLKQYEIFKSLPIDPDIPQAITSPEADIDLEEVTVILERITSPSSVATVFKDKIAYDPGFFEKGLERYKAKPDSCPFCTQDMGELAIAAVTAYANYFEDSEAQESKAINCLITNVDGTISALETWLTQYLKKGRLFDDLKNYFPSLSDAMMPNPSALVEEAKVELGAIKSSLESKLEDLSLPVSLPAVTLEDKRNEFETVIYEANESIKALKKLVGNSNDERRSIQKKSCNAFEIDFFQRCEQDIKNIRSLMSETELLSKEISEIRKTQGDKAQARDRVAETFSRLLRRFFGDRYNFDAKSFKVQRNNQEMRRGSDRTLSDGEKAALAFCYFIAQTHLRVKSNEDYENVFFVFDDPVTSMSFDFIYSIIQALKLLRIDAEGEIQFNLKSDIHRPRMLILTHNYYFFNVISTNNVVKKTGLFQLVPGDTHTLNSQKSFATPHLLQLKHVSKVANHNAAPDYSTPNAVRSVIEGMWKFCHPDLTDFQSFLKYLIDKHKIEVKSVLINHFSHHSGMDMPPDREDIRLAAQEAIRVVEIFAPGQLKDIAST